MILPRLLLDPAEGEVASAAPVSSSIATRPNVTSPSNAPKTPRAPTTAEKAFTFKIDKNDPLFSESTDVKSSDLKEDIKIVDPIDAPISKQTSIVSAATVEPKKPIEPKVIEEVKPAHKVHHEPIVPKTVEKKEYDYTGFNEAEITVLKNMSVQSRDYVTKIIKEKKELEKHKDSQFMQHPNAYTLDPQYSKLQEDVFYYNKETEYWQEQLARVKAGDTWQPIKGWTKDGQPVAGEPAVASATSEEQIRLMMNRCYTATEAKQNELKQFSTNYKQRLTTDTKAINEERARRFGWVSNPEILKSKVEIEPGLVKSVADIREDLISLFPPYMQNTQGVEVAADLFVALQIFGQENRELKAGKQVAEVKAEEITRAEPTSKNGNVNNNKGSIRGVKTFSLSGMPM